MRLPRFGMLGCRRGLLTCKGRITSLLQRISFGRVGGMILMLYILTILMAISLLRFVFYGIHFDFHMKLTRESAINYFLPESSYDASDFIINSTGCKLIDLDTFDSSILTHITKVSPLNSCDPLRRWTYVNGSRIYINRTAITKSGYEWNNLRCCFKEILRVEQTNTTYEYHRADNVVKYSLSCTAMGLVTEPKTDYVYVICQSNLAELLFGEFTPLIIYKAYHVVAVTNAARVQNTLKRWKSIDQDNLKVQGEKESNIVERPPNVLMIGMDSTSRLNFRRGMHKTKRLLDEMGAHEMLGYTKVGENTYPNAIPFLTGYEEDQMSDLCRYEHETKLDDCPFIWKHYKSAYYVTALIEDSPRLAIFNYHKTGFVVQPTDFSTRPIFLAAHQAVSGFPYSIKCIGNKPGYQFELDYIRDLVSLATSNKAPIFLMSWITQLAHDDFNNLQISDEDFLQFFRGLLDGGHLNNSILFFMSDHGYRFGPVRATLSGWFEDRLPTMWIRLPESIIKKYPEWEEALRYNERQLSSPFDLYQTLVHILKSFSNFPGVLNAPKTDGSSIPRKYGQSFFTPLPSNRTCDVAGIPDDFCACHYPVKINPDNPIVRKCALAAIEKVNSWLPPECVPLNLSKIEEAAIWSTNELEKSQMPLKYVIVYRTKPGGFVFEATLRHHIGEKGTEDRFELSGGVQRITKINTDVSCIRWSEMTTYCYCESELRKWWWESS